MAFRRVFCFNPDEVTIFISNAKILRNCNKVASCSEWPPFQILIKFNEFKKMRGYIRYCETSIFQKGHFFDIFEYGKAFPSTNDSNFQCLAQCDSFRQFCFSRKGSRSDFLVGTFRIKELDYYITHFFFHLFFFRTFSNATKFLFSSVQLNEYLGNASNSVQKVPPFFFLLFKRNIQILTRLKGPTFQFRHCATFFERFLSSEGPTSILLKPPLIISRVKHYIRTVDVISELYFVLLSRRWSFKKKFFTKTSYAYFKDCAF